jgi:predicted AAA+ superfamily ATPase
MINKKYIKRDIDKDLTDWKNFPLRKPLLLRGARQVGKSSSVRYLSKNFDYFLEVNFERDAKERNIKAVFEKGLSPKRICEELSVIYGIPLIEGKTLLFLDEIQACPQAISSLRYFYEEMQGLHIIAAGSLLEFALEEIPSFGVGRIHSVFMYPFSFGEYLNAVKEEILLDSVKKASPEKHLSESIHKKCIEHLIRFILIGSMPEVVAAYSSGASLLDCQKILDDLISSFYDDFAKYKSKIPPARLREVFASVVNQTGSKFVYSDSAADSSHKQIKESIETLSLAGLIYPVVHTSANGIPLGAQTNSKFRKFIVFDTGILQRLLKLDLSGILFATTLEQINKGALAELFVGLELIKSASNNAAPELYYWQRQERNSQAEVDYVLQRGDRIIPIEVKSGVRGAMQSMHLFLSEKKKSEYGVRCSLENFGVFENIKIYPLYAASQIK